MNKPKKHTPLTAEELVKLLDIHTNSETDLTELDDFEKEALEGFEAHTSAETAKDLMNEVQDDISKKVLHTAVTSSNEESDSKKYKIIWFSAAASLVLIVALSILFLKKSTVDSDQSIALNDAKVKEESTPTPPNETTSITTETTTDTKPLETKEELTHSDFKKQISDDGKSVTSTLKEAEQSQKNLEGYRGNKRQANNATNDEVVSGKGLFGGAVVTKQDKANDFETLETADNSKKVLADEVTSVPASARNEESASVTITYEKSAKHKDELKKEASKQQPVTVSTSAAENKLSTGNSDGDKTEADKEAYGTIAQNTSSTKAIQTTPAYFTGNEIAIKEYILAYHKKINSTQKLLGTFLIKATILSKGTLKITSITHISKDYSECKDFLKEVLNSMKNWNPATTNGTKVDSETQFMLTF